MDTKASKDRPTETSSQQNEGEGNRTAAGQYNEAQRRFVRSGGRPAGQSGGKALDSAERSELPGRGEPAATSEAGYLTGLADRREARTGGADPLCGADRLCGSGWIPKYAMYLA
jgi:hypothetical protein